MKAIISNQYGTSDSLTFQEVKKPTPKDNQVLVKVHAASLNFSNIVLLTGKPFLARFAFGLFKPKYKIPGGDIAGTVEAVGEKITNFKPGDKVYGDLSSFGWGGFAEFVAVPEDALVHKPTNLSFEEVAAVPMAGVTALQAIRDKGKLQTGQKLLIYGASGGVGTFAIQIAKAFGAEVTALCSTRNVKTAKSIGADHVIDYQKEDFAKRTERYDLIIGANGYQPMSVYKQALNPNGMFVHVGGASKQMNEAMMKGPWNKKKKISTFMQKASQDDLVVMKELIESGKVKPVIDRKYDFHEIKDAFHYFQDGHAQGKVVISVVEGVS